MHYTNEEAKKILEQKGTRQDLGIDMSGVCPRCGNPLKLQMVMNSLSRYVDCHICNDCGMDEAFHGDALRPLRKWHWVQLHANLEEASF